MELTIAKGCLTQCKHCSSRLIQQGMVCLALSSQSKEEEETTLHFISIFLVCSWRYFERVSFNEKSARSLPLGDILWFADLIQTNIPKDADRCEKQISFNMFRLENIFSWLRQVKALYSILDFKDSDSKTLKKGPSSFRAINNIYCQLQQRVW